MSRKLAAPYPNPCSGMSSATGRRAYPARPLVSNAASNGFMSRFCCVELIASVIGISQTSASLFLLAVQSLHQHRSNPAALDPSSAASSPTRRSSAAIDHG